MLKKSLIDSWSFFKINALAISLIILPIVTPIEVLNSLYQYFLASEGYVFSEQIIPLAVELAAYPLYAVGVVFYIASVIHGNSIQAKTSWKLGAKYWLPYLILIVLANLAILSGLILLVIPGIILVIRFAFIEFELLLNNNKPLEAMRTSWDGTKEYMWLILGGYTVITIVLYVPYIMITSLFDEASIAYWVLDGVSSIVYSVLGTLYTIFAFRVYELTQLRPKQMLNPDTP